MVMGHRLETKVLDVSQLFKKKTKTQRDKLHIYHKLWKAGNMQNSSTPITQSVS
jgi:hypothetical protein